MVVEGRRNTEYAAKRANGYSHSFEKMPLRFDCLREPLVPEPPVAAAATDSRAW